METIINEERPLVPEEIIQKEEENMGKKVLIATLYSLEPVLLASTRLGAERLILLIDIFRVHFRP